MPVATFSAAYFHGFRPESTQLATAQKGEARLSVANGIIDTASTSSLVSLSCL
jgi:hypothetical protein